MSKELFNKVRSLLKDHVRNLNEHSIGNTSVEDAENIIAELDLIMSNKHFIEHLEKEIDEEEHKQVSEDLAEEILSRGQHCPSGNCDM